MIMKQICLLFPARTSWLFVAGVLLTQALLAQPQPNWPVFGQLLTRDAKTIRGSTWSIGGETLDRDYTDYQSYKSYLGPLGAKRIRGRSVKR
jgi:hypothetical protein